jgi:hypothetical protein
MNPPYKKTTVPATVIVRRRSGSPSVEHTPHQKARCGHPIDLGRSPKKDCRACCKGRVAAEREASRKLRALKEQKGRLPDGSNFNLIWSTDVMTWTGTLVTTIAGKERLISASGVNAFTLMKKLDVLYRAELPENAQLMAPPVAPSAAEVTP